MSIFDYLGLVALVYVCVLAATLRRQGKEAKGEALEYEDKFRKLFEEVPLACQEIDRDGIIRRVNQKLCDLRGMKENEIIGRHYANFASESERTRVREETARKLAGTMPLETSQQVYTRKNGDLVTVEVHETLLRDANNAIAGMRLSAFDMTERLHKEEEIYQTTSELRAIFQALPDGFLRLNTDGVILDYRGPASPNFVGDDGKLLGKRLQNLVPGEVARQLDSAIARVRKSNAMVAVEYSLAGKGDEIFFEARLIPLRWKEVIAIVRDISERKRAQKRLEQYSEEVQEKNAELASALTTAREATLMKGRFLANMSHEIRTPMNGVLGMTELLLETELTPEQREYAEDVQQSAAALLTITNDILDLSKIEAGRLTIECIPFDVTATVKEVIAWFNLRARAKGLEMGAILPAEPMPVRGDPVRLRQILTNLVGNAIKFTDKGKIVVRMKVASTAADSLKLEFSVEDTGIGIAADQRERLFESFTQGDDSTTRKYGGTGLGLAISRQLVELLGGEIWVESDKGKGSVFGFTTVFEKTREGEIVPEPISTQNHRPAQAGVPKPPTPPAPAPVSAPVPAPERKQSPTVAPVAAAPKVESKPAPSPEPVPASTNANVRLDGMKVLVVASASARPAIRESLQSWGCSTDEMSGAAWIVPELRLAAQGGIPFHAAILDLEVPDLDASIGIEIAADKTVFNTALIAMATNPKPADDARLREKGFRACLSKPAIAGQLHRALVNVWRPEEEDAPVVAKQQVAEAPPPASAPAAPPPIRVESPKLVETAGKRSPRVLVAEDNLVNQKLVLRLLEKAGLKADVVANGSQAVAAIGKTAYDLILMDCQMPEMDGFEATAEIRRLEGSARHTTICALTAHAMAGDRERCLDAGMDDYISKPLTIGVLHKKIAHWIQSQNLEPNSESFVQTA
jgi:PAS domain S-box-containing protein